MDTNSILQNLNLKKEYDAVQKGINCAILTYLFYTNLNILKNIFNTKLEEFNKYTMLSLAEVKENTVILISRDLTHEIILTTSHDPQVVLTNFCIALYGQLSITSQIIAHSRDYLFQIAQTNQTLSELLF